MKNFSRQCTLKKKDAYGFEEYVSWIPEEHAILNKFLKIKIDGFWEDGWQVTSVSAYRKKSSELNERSRDYLKQRKASDI